MGSNKYQLAKTKHVRFDVGKCGCKCSVSQAAELSLATANEHDALHQFTEPLLA